MPIYAPSIVPGSRSWRRYVQDEVPPVNPISILGTSLLAWWSAPAAGSLMLSGSQVDTWIDLINGLELTDAEQGAGFSAGAWGGFGPAVTFNGSNQSLICTDIGPIPVGSDDAGVMIVLNQKRAAGVTASNRFLGWGGNSGNQGRTMRREVGSGQNYLRASVGTGSSAVFANLNAVNFSGYKAAHGVWEGGECFALMDGSVSSVAGAPATDDVRLRLGAHHAETPTDHALIDVAHLVFYSSCDSVQFAALDGWGNAQLPS